MKPQHPMQSLKAIQRYISVPYRRQKKRERHSAFLFGFSTWKDFIEDWFPKFSVFRRDREVSKFEFYTTIAPMMLSDPRSEVFIWGYKIQPMVERFCIRHGIPITKVEDGFIRSVQLGATKVPPLSLVMDPKALYFDATKPSTMEDILNTYDFDSDPELIKRAISGIDALLSSRLSKYNVGASIDVSHLYGPKDRKRVLVVGQVEGDMSIKKGCDRPLNNNDLVWIAASENPEAQIIYKPHPEVLHKTRPQVSNPRDVEGIATILTQDIALADALETVDHVYTITSLAGFEALLRGIEVTCAGAPFYAGWGLTNDLQSTPRRKRELTIEQLFAAAYILYPRYFDPNARRDITFEQALSLLSLMKKSAMQKSDKITERKAIQEAAVAGLGSAPVLPSPTNAEIKLEAIRAIRRLVNVIDPPPRPQPPAKPPAKKVPSKPDAKRRPTPMTKA